MNLQELRRGNYLYIGGLERYVKVTALFLSHFKCTDENGIDFNNHQNNIRPIKLTEEILLKCGFEKGLKYFSYKDFDIDLKGWFGFNNMVANANIKHLHQLQNLYFALTNEELEINL